MCMDRATHTVTYVYSYTTSDTCLSQWDDIHQFVRVSCCPCPSSAEHKLSHKSYAQRPCTDQIFIYSCLMHLNALYFRAIYVIASP